MSDDETAEIIAIFTLIQKDRFIDLAVIVFFVYDFATTFDREVRHFWGRRFSSASVLFLSIRYSYLLQGLAYILASVLRSNEVTQWIYTVFLTSLYLPIAVFSGARAYALSRTRLVAGLVTLLSLAPFCVNWIDWALFERPTIDAIFGCGINVFTTEQNNIMVPLIIADILLVTITWCKLGGELKKLRLPFVKRGSTSFSDILLENGLLYFVTLSVLNSLHLIFTMTSMFIDGNGSFGPSMLTRFIDPLEAVLIYRFILDLQEANERNVKVGSNNPELQMSQTGSQSSSSFVDRAIGSLGSTIHRRTSGSPTRDEWDEDILDKGWVERSHFQDMADHAILLDDLPVVQPMSHYEIQGVHCDEPLANLAV